MVDAHNGRRPLPIHLAVHYLASAEMAPEGVRTRSEAGRMIEGIAEGVDRLTLVAYEPSEHPSNEDTTDYLIRTARNNVDLLSLGPKGTWRQYLGRRRRIRDVVAGASPAWDVLMLRLVNRRAHLVWRANRCSRVVVHVGGSLLAFALGAPAQAMRKARMIAYGTWAEINQRRIIRSADVTFAVGEDLLARYGRIGKRVVLLRGSALRRSDLHSAPDRLTGPGARFLFCGQIHPSKGVFDVVRAFARIRADLLPDAHLHIVGDGPAIGEVRRTVADVGVADAVSFHGWVSERDDLFALYREMDVLLCLSRVDFLPRVIWEALGTSVLVVTTPVGAVPTVFSDEVRFVPVGDIGAVSTAVAELSAQPKTRRHMLERGMARAQDATLESFTEHFLDELVRRWPELARERR